MADKTRLTDPYWDKPYKGGLTRLDIKVATPFELGYTPNSSLDRVAIQVNGNKMHKSSYLKEVFLFEPQNEKVIDMPSWDKIFVILRGKLSVVVLSIDKFTHEIKELRRTVLNKTLSWKDIQNDET